MKCYPTGQREKVIIFERSKQKKTRKERTNKI